MAAAASAQHAAYAEAELQLVHKLREAESAATRAADAQQAAMVMPCPAHAILLQLNRLILLLARRHCMSMQTHRL